MALPEGNGLRLAAAAAFSRASDGPGLGYDRDSEAAYAAKMSALHAAYPDDTEAAIFHALALAITARKAANDFANEKQCDDILEPLVKAMPNKRVHVAAEKASILRVQVPSCQLPDSGM